MSLLDYEEQDRQFRALTATRNRPMEIPAAHSTTLEQRAGHVAITTDAAAVPSLPPIQTAIPPYLYTRVFPLPVTKWSEPLLDTGHDYEVKSWPWFFEPMIDGQKTHDMRDKSERNYAIGDRVLLREFDPRGAGYTGRAAVATITYITSNDTPCAMSSNALAKDACILSVAVGPAFDYAGGDA